MPPKNRRPATPSVCPVCSEDVPPRALACPHCGADHNSGWKDGALIYDGMDLPDEEFSYDEFMKREFGGQGDGPRIKPIWVITSVALIVACLLYYAMR